MTFEDRMEELQANIKQFKNKIDECKLEKQKLVDENMHVDECPICHEDSYNFHVEWYPAIRYKRREGWSLYCDFCGAHTPFCKTFKEAREMWNAMVAVRDAHREDYAEQEHDN